jgi:hypothetical protein
MSNPNDLEGVSITFTMNAKLLKAAGIDMASEDKQELVDLLLDAVESYMHTDHAKLDGKRSVFAEALLVEGFPPLRRRIALWR